MICPEEEAIKQKTFDEAGRVKGDHAEGATIHSIPAAVFVVRDQFISTVCSGCLKTQDPAGNATRLQNCSKCKFLTYCSRDCQVRCWTQKINRPEVVIHLLTFLQTRDWKKCHKDECGMLKAVWKSCPNQDTSFARLFVRNGLKLNVSFHLLFHTEYYSFDVNPSRMIWKLPASPRFPALCRSVALYNALKTA